MLKSIDRINNMIDKRLIKRIFIFDGWNGKFVERIDQLFRDKVEILIIRNSTKNVDGIRFYENDCILFYETIINDRGEAKESVLYAAKIGKAFIKVLTEDIFSVEDVRESFEKNIGVNKERIIDNIKLLNIKYNYEPLMLKVNKDLSIDDLKNIEEYFKGLENVIILPKWIDIVGTNSGYKLFTKEDYKRYILSNKDSHSFKGFIKHFEEYWKKISKGYNFIIGVGKEDDLTFYSVEYFNKEVLEDKTMSKLSCDMNIAVLDIEDLR